MNFEDIKGQDRLKEHLKDAVFKEQVSHAYLISGEKDSGKMMLAKRFAAALLCENHKTTGGDACGVCHSCKQIAGDNHPDVIYVSHEKPNTISVDDIRVQVNHDIMTKPYASDHKIYIIDEAEKMNEQAQNAILKTIEEPPSYGMIILLASNAASFLPTIRSRCIQLEMKPVSDEIIRKTLMEEEHVPDYLAQVSCAFAQGNLGKAIRLSRSEEFREMKEHVVSVVRRIDRAANSERMDMEKEMETYKGSMDEYLDLLLVWYRDVLLCKSGGNEEQLIYADQLWQIEKQAEAVTYAGLNSIIDAIQEARSRIGANVNLSLVLELLLDTMHDVCADD